MTSCCCCSAASSLQLDRAALLELDRRSVASVELHQGPIRFCLVDGSEDPASAEVTEEGGTVILHLTGEIDSAGVVAIAPVIEDVMAVTAHDVIVDLGEVSFFSTAGVQVLAHLAQRLAAVDRRLLLRNVPAAVSRILEVLDIRHEFTVVDS